MDVNGNTAQFLLICDNWFLQLGNSYVNVSEILSMHINEGSVNPKDGKKEENVTIYMRGMKDNWVYARLPHGTLTRVIQAHHAYKHIAQTSNLHQENPELPLINY